MTRSRSVPTADALAKAEVLAEALPWLERFRGATVVVKYGGNAMTSTQLQVAFAADVVFLRLAGLRPVVVHGGGPQISAMLARLGVPSEFRGGLRVTTPEVMDVVRMVLTGQVQRDLVGLVNVHGPFAVGISGEDAHLFAAERRATGDGAFDLGLVGDVTEVRPDFVVSLLDDGLIPVVSTIGVDRRRAGAQRQRGHRGRGAGGGPGRGQADGPDRRRGAVRGLAGPREPGHRDPRRRAGRAHPGLDSGMAPKMEACLRAVTGGVPQAHVVDGRVPHSILLEIFTSEGVGTMVLPDEEPA